MSSSVSVATRKNTFDVDMIFMASLSLVFAFILHQALLTWQKRKQQPDGRIPNSNWFVNSFVMVVNEISF